jgi:hypothetical protein
MCNLTYKHQNNSWYIWSFSWKFLHT